mmetsp:Transcript_9369/g.14358  ORF Transcript_9369/g.14358 Transcript_9369/m.14358 type:complete len:385 (-) Transcript_9369:160-1314(-)
MRNQVSTILSKSQNSDNTIMVAFIHDKRQLCAYMKSSVIGCTHSIVLVQITAITKYKIFHKMRDMQQVFPQQNILSLVSSVSVSVCCCCCACSEWCVSVSVSFSFSVAIAATSSSFVLFASFAVAAATVVAVVAVVDCVGDSRCVCENSAVCEDRALRRHLQQPRRPTSKTTVSKLVRMSIVSLFSGLRDISLISNVQCGSTHSNLASSLKPAHISILRKYLNTNATGVPCTTCNSRPMTRYSVSFDIDESTPRIVIAKRKVRASGLATSLYDKITTEIVRSPNTSLTPTDLSTVTTKSTNRIQPILSSMRNSKMMACRLSKKSSMGGDICCSAASVKAITMTPITYVYFIYVMTLSTVDARQPHLVKSAEDELTSSLRSRVLC